MTKFIAGLDVGQARDYTALAILERVDPNGATEIDRVAVAQQRHRMGIPEEALDPIQWHLRALDRLPLGMPYPAMADEIVRFMNRLPLGSALGIDYTGVGRPFFDILKPRIANLISVGLHGGDDVIPKDTGWSIPNRDIINQLKLSAETGQLQVAPSLKEWPACKDELNLFTRTVSTTGHDSYAAGRQAPHDDMVFAVGYALWLAVRDENSPKWGML